MVLRIIMTDIDKEVIVITDALVTFDSRRS